MTRFLCKLALLISVLLPGLPTATVAQTDQAEDDRGYLQALLEDNLSDVGRDIRIIGFSGAFSSSATVDQITIADTQGVWLTLNDVVLNWNRAALLRGAIDITELSADEILIDRRPIADPDMPAPEASGFSLPDLPVSVEIDLIRARAVNLAESVIGEAAIVSLEGAAQLSGGTGQATLDIQRTDGPDGALTLDGRYDNASKELGIDLTLKEGAGGIAANMLGLPGRPKVALTIAGAGPLADFTADIDLSTNGQKRLAGQVVLTDEPSTATDTDGTDTPAPTKLFRANVSGDLAPVFLPTYREFFGPNVTLGATGRRFPDGALAVEALEVSTDALSLKGDLALSAGGWPERFSLTGRIADKAGASVLLPLAGAKTFVQNVQLDVSYDAATSEGWQADFDITQLSRPDLALERAALVAKGTLIRGDGTALGQVNGDVTLQLSGIAPKTQELAAAIGPEITGQMSFGWREKAPLTISDLRLSGQDYALTGSLQADDFDTGITITTRDNPTLRADDLSRFAGLAGVPLNGAVQVGLGGTANLLGGAFDLKLDGRGRDLGIGQPRFDPLIAGASTLVVDATRDKTGTRLNVLRVETQQATASLSADLKTDTSSAKAEIQIADTSLIEAGLRGPAQITVQAQQSGSVWSVTANGTGPGDLVASTEGTVAITSGAPGKLQGKVTATAGSLAPYARLVGQPVTGALDVTANGMFDLQDGSFQAAIDGTGRDLGLGQATLDLLTRGNSQFSAKAHRTAEGIVFIDALDVQTTEGAAQITGASDNGRNTLQISARLRDLGLLADGISGPAEATGTAVLVDDAWQIAFTGTGPGGVNATANGSVRADGSAANLDIDGVAPLALANRMIRPRLITGQASYDLALSGPLALSSLSGTVQTQGARLVLPTFRQSISIDTATVTLAAGRATVNVAATVETGGQLAATGSIGMATPYTADMQISVDNVTLTDARLFETLVNGSATLNGPLIGGATLRADLALGKTEIRVPEAASITLPVMDGLVHVNEPAAVRRTRANAGLIQTEDDSTQTARPYPIDITLSAPSQMFVRGRGLDAELGGQLRLTGTSANVIPQGQFDLIRGRLDILGKRLTLTEGRVSLQGDFDPILRFIAESEAEGVQVRIGVEGPATAPDVTFTSSPELPEDEVLALLLFGRDITQISALQALQLAAAVRTLAGKGGEGIVGKLRNNFGLDDLDITTDENGSAAVKAGKYISENIYTDVTVGADGDTEVNLNLNITPSLTARGTVGTDGKSTIGVFFERDY